MRTLTVVALLCAVLIAPLAAQKKKPFPDSATGRALNALFALMESGDEGNIRAFIDKYFDPEFRDYLPLDEHVAQFRSLHEELGVLHAMSVDKPNRFTAILEVRATESDGRYRIRIELNPDPPHGIVGLRVEPMETQEIPELAQGSVDESAVVAGELGRRMDKVMRDETTDGFSGAVLAVKDGEVVLHKGYGWADRARRVPVTTETVFDVASYAKSITKMAILKLEEQGQLTTDDPITRFFDNVPEEKRGITIHHLLTMQSGLHEYHDRSGDFEEMDREQAIDRIMAQELRFTPGEDRGYSNSGYGLLAAIVEKVSGQPYLGYVQKELFEPAGLRHTGYYRDPRWTSEQVAHGYDARKFGEENSPSHWPEITWACIGGGCLVSSPGDQGRWLEALLDHKVLSKSAIDKLYATYKKGMETDWGGETLAFAEGNDFGFTAGTFEFPGTRTYLFISTNTGRVRAPRLGMRLAKLMFGVEDGS